MRSAAQYLAAGFMAAMIGSGIFLAGVLYERTTRPAPKIVNYCPLPTGLQLSCHPRDRAEYDSICRSRSQQERFIPPKRIGL